ncbi:methyltransferase domain-containing protein [Geomonas nitrogeniifigens]|uniref:class I SAM-dependent methyltransferase n=1 Tax=Geomonas diazotrophica TaxID=2843197 RepID=UPI001C2B9C63|nr:methyltransferase domain-containing protein [Geomonas nitrogeniifigens]QXE85800.1 methyltransferase domain-containing protein [Geomonas nitrogeniifigens]
MESDRVKWDQRYSGPEHFFSLAPSRLLADSLERILFLVPGRRALDLACGEGRNSIYLAQHGFDATGVDISPRGLERARRRAAEVGVAAEFIEADLESWRPQGGYDLILNFNFLMRDLIPSLVEVLVPGGVLLMETILDAPGVPGEHRKDFLLQPGELGRIFAGYAGRILLLEEDVDAPEMPVARVMFQKQVEVKVEVEEV